MQVQYTYLLEQKNGFSLWKRIVGAFLAFLLLLSGLAYKYAALPKRIVYVCYREFNQYRTNLNFSGFNVLKGEHFKILYPFSEAKEAELVLEAAEKAFSPVNSILHYKSFQEVPVIIYSSREALNRNFGWDSSQSAMGVYWAGVMHILSPRAWIDDGDKKEYRETFIQHGPMVHEYAHYVVDSMAGGNYPRWLTEGIAQYVERVITGYVFEGALLDHEALYSIGELDAYFDDPQRTEAAYRQSLKMVDFLVDSYGEEVLIEILNRLGRGMTLSQAFKEELGVSLTEFERQFILWAQKN